MVYYDNIPEELKKLDQWVCANDGSKVPMKAWENEAASSTNPETWSDFETALESYNQHYYDYCGFVFADNGYVGIDIDEGYDEDGLMSVLGADIVGKCHSYTEKSRSGRGFHILLRGTLPFKGQEQSCWRGDLQGGSLLHYDRGTPFSTEKSSRTKKRLIML